MARSFNIDKCCVEDYTLLYDDELLSNCVPRVLRKSILVSPDTGAVIRTEISLSFEQQSEDGQVKNVSYDVSVKELERLKLVDVDIDFYAKSDKLVVDYIKTLIPEAPTVRKYYFDSFGWWHVDGRYIFNCGDEMIGNVENIDYIVSRELSGIHMVTDADLTPQDTFKAVWNIFANDGKTRLIILYIFGAVLRQLFKDAGYFPKTVLYIEARTQSGKTTCVQGIGCPFVSANGTFPNYTRVSSTQAVVEEAISFFKDTLYIYDDVYCDSDTKIRRAIEERVKGILRNSADDAPRNKKGASNQINAQLLLIGEELIDSSSNIGRLLVIKLKHKYSSEFLSTIRSNKQHINTFYFHFIRWLAEKYDDIVADIKHEFEVFSNGQRGEISRDFDTRFFFNYIARVFCRYACECSDMTKEQMSYTLKGIGRKQEDF